MQMNSPRWLQLTDELLWPLAVAGLERLDPKRSTDLDTAAVSYCALIHLGNCFRTINQVNVQGMHSVAVSLIRQAVETLSLIDLGLQDSTFAFPLIQAWQDGKKTQGQLRALLELHVWPSYGSGLWDESWAEYFANLSRAVQPYAHYSPELMGWQLATFGFDGEERFFGTLGPNNYDPVKASRITLLLSLAAWTLGRLLVLDGKSQSAVQNADKIREWGEALGKSKLLFQKSAWGSQLLPHMLFTPGSDWRDE